MEKSNVVPMFDNVVENQAECHLRRVRGGAKEEERENAGHGGDSGGTEHRLRRYRSGDGIRVGRPFRRPFYQKSRRGECNKYVTNSIVTYNPEYPKAGGFSRNARRGGRAMGAALP